MEREIVNDPLKESLTVGGREKWTQLQNAINVCCYKERKKRYIRRDFMVESYCLKGRPKGVFCMVKLESDFRSRLLK